MMSRGGHSRALPIALLLLGAGSAVAGLVMRDRARAPQDLSAVTAPLRAQGLRALEAKAKPFEGMAIEAARTSELAAAFQNDVDAATFQDALDSEDWWKPFRGDGRVSAVVANGKVLASLFFEKPAPVLDGLTSGVRDGHAVSGLVKGDGRIYALGAAAVERSAKALEHHAILVIGKPLDAAALTEAAGAAGAALGLSDGTQVLLAGGPSVAAEAFSSLAGKEKLGPVLTANGLPAVASEIAEGLWLWVVGSTVVEAAGPPAAVVYGPFGLAAILIGFALVLLTRRPPRVVHTPALEKDEPVTSAVRVPAPIAAHLTGDRPSDDVAVRPTEMAASGGPAPAAAAADVRPNVLGRYTLLDKIGEGGMAEVFMATLFGAEGFQRQLVVKRLHSALAANKEAVSQFIDEARLQSGLVHSNIVPVFDFGRAGQDYFLALEYIEGKDLSKMVARHVEVHGKPLPLSLAAYIVSEVLTALEFAHTRTDKTGRRMEIVHRDVSLGNVLISQQGEVKLSDFGIVKAERRVSHTQLGMIKGNTGFMAPEQARGEPVDARADVFSAGVVMYCCLTGQGLYESESNTPMNQLLRASVGPAQTQFNRIHALSPAVAPVIERAIAADFKLRFASAGEFGRALRPFISSSREDVAKTLHELFGA